MWTTITDHAVRMRRNIFSQFHQAPRIMALVYAIADSVQAVEDDIDDLITSRTLDTATGASLDQYAAIVGEERGGLTDSDLRRVVKAKAILNRATGKPADLCNAIALLCSVDAADVSFVEVFPKSIQLDALVAAVSSDELRRRIARMIDETRPGGTAINARESTATTFRFDTAGQGFDDGEFTGAMTTD